LALALALILDWHWHWHWRSCRHRFRHSRHVSPFSPDCAFLPGTDGCFPSQLPYRVRWQDLKDLFRKAGTVLRADVSLGPDNRSRGHGTVLLATAEDAGRAVDMFNGYSWQSRVLEVRLDRLPGDFDNFSNPPSGYHTPALFNSHPSVIPNLRSSYVFPSALPPSVNPLSSSSFLPQIPLRGTLDESYPDHPTVFGHDRQTIAGGISRNLFVGNVGLLMVVIHSDFLKDV
jgi:RNA recognition motif. (a.k.a. RRM, RBD, or RNP domain)